MALNTLFKSFAIAGSTILVVCIIPQLSKVYQSKSAKDISYSWIILTKLGLMFLCLYSFYFELWEIFIPILVQLVLFTCLLFLKRHYDNININNLQLPS